MVAMGFILATFLAYRWASRVGIKPGMVIDLSIWMVLWGVVGSRILHVLADGHFWDYVHMCTDPSLVDWKVDALECHRLKGAWDAAKGVCHPVQSNCWAWADIASGGLAFYGGFIAATIYGFFFIKKYQLPAGKLIDMAGWAIMLGLAWGRMGCFLGSCCFGARTDSIVGVVFPAGTAPAHYQWQSGLLRSYRIESLPVHPTQIYESLAGLLIAAFAYFVLRPRKSYDGQVFVIASILYAVLRFAIEFWRRDERGGLLGISTSQLIAILVVVFAFVVAHLFKKKKRAALKH